MKIDSNGNYVVQNQINPKSLLTGTLQDSVFSHIQTMFVNADVINRDFYFGPTYEVGPGLPFPQRPPDLYIMAYDDVAVNVIGIDYAPADIRKIIETMNALIQGSIKTSHIDSWELCE